MIHYESTLRPRRAGPWEVKIFSLSINVIDKLTFGEHRGHFDFQQYRSTWWTGSLNDPGDPVGPFWVVSACRSM